MNEKREIRNITAPVNADVADDKRTVEGYALLFNTASDGLDFREVIEEGALDGVIARSDVFALLNHDRTRGILARCMRGSGSLELSVDEKGLKYRFEAPKTALGDELLENLRRGEINQSSFAFDVDSDTWTRQDDGNWTRTIHQFGNLYDVSPVYNAAYSQTSVYMRGKEEAERAIEEAENANTIPDSYYEDLYKQFNI